MFEDDDEGLFSQNDNGGASNASDDAADGDGIGDDLGSDSSQQALQQFWVKVMDEIKGITPDHFKTQALPLARIKKIMKLDDDVKMISAEAPILFAKAAEIFVQELTLRAWTHTEDNKRRTLQKNDIAMALSKSDQFDFLIDIVPRHDTVVTKVPRREPLRPSSTEVHVVQPPATNSTVVQSSSPQPQIVLQPYTQFVQQQSTNGSPTPSTSSQSVVLQQLVSPSDNIPVPIQLTAAQLNSIRMQMQNNGNQPIIIQTQAQQGQQILQVSPSNQQQVSSQPLFLVSSNSENES